MRVALAKKPKSQGPGLLLLVVALVVVAVAGARFFGFVPGGDGGGRPPGDGPRVVEEGPSGGAGVLPRPQQMTEVLIYHTHTTENYSPKATHAMDGAGDVAAVGRALVEELEKQGVNSVHLLTVHDLPQWGGAAQNARTSVAEALERNSGVRIVLDIHRDAIADPPAESGYASAVIDGEEVAKLLLIVGTGNNPRVDANIRFAERLKDRLEQLAPGITRGVRVLPRETNGDLHDHHVTVYVGDYRDTTPEEAARAMRWLATAVAELLREDG